MFLCYYLAGHTVFPPVLLSLNMHKTAEVTCLFTVLRFSRKVFQKCLLLVLLHSCCPDTKDSLINEKQTCLGLAQSFLLISRHINTSHVYEGISRTWGRLTFKNVLVVSCVKRASSLKKTKDKTKNHQQNTPKKPKKHKFRIEWKRQFLFFSSLFWGR